MGFRNLRKIPSSPPYPMTDPWDERYISLHECLIFMVNVGKYTIQYMDPMAIVY